MRMVLHSSAAGATEPKSSDNVSQAGLHTAQAMAAVAEEEDTERPNIYAPLTQPTSDRPLRARAEALRKLSKVHHPPITAACDFFFTSGEEHTEELELCS